MEETGKTPTNISSNNNNLETLTELLKAPLQVDLSSNSLIRLSGPDAKTFLQGQLTNDITKITPTQGQYAAICTNQGRVQSVFSLFQHQDDYLLALPNDNHAALLEQLRQFGHFSKVDIRLDCVFQAHIGVVGAKVIEHLSASDPDYRVWQDPDCLIIKTPGMVDRYEIFGRNSQNLNSIISVDQTPTNLFNVWSAIDIVLGLPHIEQETTALFTPHMLNLQKLGAVSFTKGCYIGQEIVARTEHKGQVKRTTMLAYQTNQIIHTPGEALYDETGHTAGTILNVAQVSDDLQYLLIVTHLSDNTLSLHDNNQHGITIINNNQHALFTLS